MQPKPVVTAGPRTVRCRKALGDVFDRVFFEIQTLEIVLKSVLAKLLTELDFPFSVPTMDAPSAIRQGDESRMAEPT